jgi:hypothetical protein
MVCHAPAWQTAPCRLLATSSASRAVSVAHARPIDERLKRRTAGAWSSIDSFSSDRGLVTPGLAVDAQNRRSGSIARRHPHLEGAAPGRRFNETPGRPCRTRAASTSDMRRIQDGLASDTVDSLLQWTGYRTSVVSVPREEPTNTRNNRPRARLARGRFLLPRCCHPGRSLLVRDGSLSAWRSPSAGTGAAAPPPPEGGGLRQGGRVRR